MKSFAILVLSMSLGCFGHPVDPILPYIPRRVVSWVSAEPSLDDQLTFRPYEPKSELVRVPNAAWLQLMFRPERTLLPPGSVLKVVSEEDGYEQILDAESLKQWNFRSAYFNGDAVRVEVVSLAEPVNGRVSEGQFEVTEVVVGEFINSDMATSSICTRDGTLL